MDSEAENIQVATIAPDAKPQAAAPVALPAALRTQFNGELDGHTIIAWAQFDLDEQNRFAKQFVVLSETDLFVLRHPKSSAVSVAIAQMEEAKVNEGLGVDRLVLI